MKKSSRLLAVLLSAVLILVLALPGMAAMPELGTITVENPNPGVSYRAYRILELESYSDPNPEDPADGAYSYRVDPEWAEFVKAQSAYLKVDDSGYVTWVEDADPAAFAKLAGAWAREKSIVPDAGPETSAEGQPVTFENLPLGYYMIDSSVGVLCSLDTTNPSVTIYEKNEEPTIDKKVWHPGVDWGSSTELGIGELARYEIRIGVKPGAVNYVVEDTMSKGLDFCVEDKEASGPSIFYTGVSGNDSEEIRDLSLQANRLEAPEETVAYSFVNKQQEVCADFTAVSQADGSTKIVIHFTDDFVQNQVRGGLDYYGDKLEPEIRIRYMARVNDDAVRGQPGNPNTVHLRYGHTPKVTPDVTNVVYTFEFHVYKHDGENPLPGAKFILYRLTKPVAPKSLMPPELPEEKPGEYPMRQLYKEFYKKAEDRVIWFYGGPDLTQEKFDQMLRDGRISEYTTDEAGNVTFTGLGPGTYYLWETEAPAGYNQMKTPIQINIAKDGTVTYNAPGEGGTQAQDQVVPVVNKTGSELPSTGGMGTGLFYGAGALLMLSALYLLLKKKKAA